MSTLTLSYHRYTDRSWRPTTRKLLMLMTVWYQRGRQRQQLAQLTDRELRDIGISHAEAQTEASKPFWQA